MRSDFHVYFLYCPSFCTDSVPLTNDLKSSVFTIGDYGTADGATSMALMWEVIGKCAGFIFVPEFLCILEDCLTASYFLLHIFDKTLRNISDKRIFTFKIGTEVWFKQLLCKPTCVPGKPRKIWCWSYKQKRRLSSITWSFTPQRESHQIQDDGVVWVLH